MFYAQGAISSSKVLTKDRVIKMLPRRFRRWHRHSWRRIPYQAQWISKADAPCSPTRSRRSLWLSQSCMALESLNWSRNLIPGSHLCWLYPKRTEMSHTPWHKGFEQSNSSRELSHAYNTEDITRLHQARSWGFWKGVRVDSNIYQEGLLNMTAERVSL